jgi:hypothetical protein
VRGVSGTLAVACALDTPGVVGEGGEPAGDEEGRGVCVAPGTFDEGELCGLGEAGEEVVEEFDDAEFDDGELLAASGRAERKASVRPSGDQRGVLEDCRLAVNCRGVLLPSVATTQTCETRRFCFWSTVVTT